MIDLNILNRGEDYEHLKKSLIIFVCTFDPFDHDEYIYRCGTYYPIDDGTYHLVKDDAYKIFINADGHIGNVSDNFKTLMRYIMEGKADNAYTQALENKVSLVNNDDEWKVSYMTMAMKLADERREGKREGKKEGSIQTLYELYNDGDLPLRKAAARAGMSENDFLKAGRQILSSDAAKDKNPF